jgi:rSAM/selenodomain-associated transferase 1
MPTPVNALAVMAKAPVAGSVKTRLVPPLSERQAAEFSRALLVDLLGHVQRLRVAQHYLFFAPDHAAEPMAELAGGQFQLLAQRGDDLGARMQAVFGELWARGHRRIVLIGGDLPVFPLDFLEQAFAWLDTAAARVVLGPSRDGGYYLIGMNRLAPEIFSDMTWSHDKVLRETLRKINEMNLEALQLPPWFDVDTPADLVEMRHLVRAGEESMKNTADVLRRMNF